MISFEMSDDQKKLQGLARELAVDFAKRAARHDEDRSMPMENYQLLKDAGFYGLAVPKALGGMECGLLGWTIVATELAKGCSSTTLAFNMHVNSTGLATTSDAFNAQSQKLVADMAVNQGKLFSYGVSEPSTSSLVIATAAPSVQARRVQGGFLLFGKKAFLSNWEASDLCYFYAHLENDTNPNSGMGLMVDTKAEGCKVTDWWDTTGMRATRSQYIEYDGVFVPDEHMLHSTENFLEFFLTAPWPFGSYTAVYLGVGLNILDHIKAYLVGRIPKGFTQSIGYHPDIRRRVTQMTCDMEAAQNAMWRAGFLHDSEGLTPRTIAAVLKAKYVIGESVSRTAENAKICGGIHNLFKGQVLERLLRDAGTAPIMPPNTDACAEAIGLMELGLNPTQACEPMR